MSFETSLRDNLTALDALIKPEISFDIKKAELRIGDVFGALYYIDGFVKKEELIKIHEACLSAKLPELERRDAMSFAEKFIPYADYGYISDANAASTALHAGKLLMFVDTLYGCAALDARDYPRRSITEPDKSKTLRGPHEGFTESLITNTALLRRRIKTDALKLELFRVGRESQTDISLCYMEGKCDARLLNSLRERLSKFDVPSLIMAQETLAELLFPKRGIQKLNPLPTIRYVERPDTASAMLEEGRILLICDTSPSAISVPAGFFDFFDEADDYYFPSVTAFYLRAVRLIITLLSVFLVPLWLFFATSSELLPEWLSFVTELDDYAVPLVMQILIIEIAIDGLKLASLNTPDTLSNSLSVVGGLLLGDFAVKSGWFVPETILYCSFTAIANFIPTNYELGYSLKFMRLLLIVAVALGGLWGAALALFIIFIALLTAKTADGLSYLRVRKHVSRGKTGKTRGGNK